MVSGSNDAVDCFFSSLNAVQSSFLQAAKDLEDKFPLILHSPPKFSSNNNNKIKHLLNKDDDGGEDPLSSVSSSPPSARLPPPPFKLFLFNSSTSSPSRCIGIANEIHNDNVKTKKKHKHKRKRENGGQQDETCVDCCLHFAFLSWSVLSQGLVQAFPNPFKNGKKNHLHKQTHDCDTRVAHVSVKSQQMKTYEYDASEPPFPTASATGCFNQGANVLSLKHIVPFLFNHLLHKLDKGILHTRHKFSSPFDFDHIGIIKGILKGGQADVSCFLGNLSFARVGGAPQSMVGAKSVKEDGDGEGVDNAPPLSNKEESEGNSAKKIANGLLNIPLSNVDRLRSTLSAVSLTELIELIPQMGRPSNDYPDKKKLISVQDFFKYTESEANTK